LQRPSKKLETMMTSGLAGCELAAIVFREGTDHKMT